MLLDDKTHSTDIRSMNVSQALQFAASELKKAQFSRPLHEAEILLCSVLSCTRSGIYVDFDRMLSPQELLAYQAFVGQRLKRTPLQYITYRQNFRYLDLRVKEGVFIPRPETELLVECVVNFLKSRELPAVVDVGTGSGAIALSVAFELPESRVIAIDVCPKALALASENANNLGLQKRVRFVESDLFENFDYFDKGEIDVVVSNPPYVLSADIEKLQREIRDFEPVRALDGGNDGLSVIKRIIRETRSLLKPGGLLALEVGCGQANDVANLVDRTREFKNISILKDYSGIDRIVTATR